MREILLRLRPAPDVVTEGIVGAVLLTSLLVTLVVGLVLLG